MLDLDVSLQWARAETCRDLIGDRAWLKQLAQPKPEKPAADDEAPEPVERSYTVEVSGKRFDVTVHGEAAPAQANGAAQGAARKPARSKRSGAGGAGADGDELVSPLQGNLWKLLVEKGAEVQEGQLICIVEAMKMENEVAAHKSGTVEDLPVSEGAAVNSGDTLAVIK